MKKVFYFVTIFSVFCFAGCSKKSVDYSSYTIRIYSNSNSKERADWLVRKANAAGFSISIDDQSIVSGDAAVVKEANENNDADVIFGLNEARWIQIMNGDYPNIKLLKNVPSWASQIGKFYFEGKAYGIVVQNVLMLYRTDELGTNGKELHFKHWSDISNSGYKWYRQGKVGGTTNGNINNAMLYPYIDPSSPAGGVSVEGWKKLWKYCEGGIFSGDSYGFAPLNRGDVQISTFYSSALYGEIEAAHNASKDPITPSNWKLVEIDDGTYYIAEYIGVVDKIGRSENETKTVLAFVDWFGSSEIQSAWSEEFNTFPCNVEAAKSVYGNNVPVIYTIENFALNMVSGTDLNYAEYVAEHNAQWTNIMTNLGFYWDDSSKNVSEPDWENLDWNDVCRKK